MSTILLVIGMLITGAGVIAIGFGVRNIEFSLGDTLITAGTTAFSAGLILIGLAAAVGQLTRIAEAARARPVPRPGRSPELKPAVEAPLRDAPLRDAPPRDAPPRPPRELRPPEPKPAANTGLDVSASAIERLRSAIPRPDKVVAEAEEVPLSPGPVQHPAPSPAFEPTARASSAAAEAKGPRLDFMFRSKAAPSAPAEPKPVDTLWPKRQRDLQGQPRPEPSLASAPPAERAPGPSSASASDAEDARRAAEARSPAEPEEPTSAAILKSGVVDGMAYTLYADGAIEAQLPDGTVRFGSIAELRSHIENNS